VRLLADTLPAADLELSQSETLVMPKEPAQPGAGGPVREDDIVAPKPTTASAAATSEALSGAFALLLSIYSSTDVFLADYKQLLAERLLTALEYNIEREVRNIELLKLRFGEHALHQCEVMLKDMAESKRLDSRVHELNANPLTGPVHAFVLSRLFWPHVRIDETVRLHSTMQAALDAYGRAFELQRPNRRLAWIHQQGTVDLTLTTSDGAQRQFSGIPTLTASVIMSFTEKPSWSAAQLAQHMKITSVNAHRRLAFWVSQGMLVFREATGEFHAIDDPNLTEEELAPHVRSVSAVADSDEDDVAAGAGVRGQLEAPPDEEDGDENGDSEQSQVCLVGTAIVGWSPLSMEADGAVVCDGDADKSGPASTGAHPPGIRPCARIVHACCRAVPHHRWHRVSLVPNVCRCSKCSCQVRR
jgi:hypothetical protein